MTGSYAQHYKPRDEDALLLKALQAALHLMA